MSKFRLGFYKMPFLHFKVRHRWVHPRRPRDSQSGREKGPDESFLVRAKEPLGTDSHRAISKNSSGCRLLIGHKKCFVLLCPIGEQFLLSSFREFVHDGYCLVTLAWFVHPACASKKKIVSNFTRLTPTYNNFEISFVVFMPNITTNHAITYTNHTCSIFYRRLLALTNFP